jgi:hypothetical protein
MARRVFFSFHFADSWRANQVRMANVVSGPDASGFYDHSEYAETRKGRETVRREILRHLDGTTVTVVLIGTHTAERDWVDVEIRESIKQGNGILGIRIHHLIAPPPNWPNAPRHFWGPSQPGRLPTALPPGTPIFSWDPQKVQGFAKVIEEAGQRADRMRANTAGQQRRALSISPPPIPPWRPGNSPPRHPAMPVRGLAPPPTPAGSTLADALKRIEEEARLQRLFQDLLKNRR